MCTQSDSFLKLERSQLKPSDIMIKLIYTIEDLPLKMYIFRGRSFSATRQTSARQRDSAQRQLPVL